MSSYRVQSPQRDVQDLLDPEFQVSMSYGGDDVRAGVSVFESEEQLATYLAGSGVEFDPSWVLVELDGPYAEDEDLDAQFGAKLIVPSEIISVEPIADRFLDMILAAYDAVND